ncbi:CHAT domain-containing protein [Polyangium sp. y55x31]|uniref:nSTAND1 domain-containing NTPase n=1 Tax=Polyangium sp. y55x31 TaxID=3042688 RepID=UPI002482B072|nr:CHAT domain-containing protein [Polyangium sp. y55x31]MDI1483038.1 CHAT domain-containing protein [Polyangium sp. y55x31]
MSSPSPAPPPGNLLLEFTRTAQADESFVLPDGEVTYVLRTEGGGAETVTIDWTPALFADLDAVRRPGCDPAIVQRLGRALRRFLAPAGWARHEESILDASSRGDPVRITLRSNAAELYALPWELLTLKSSGQHLGELPNVLVRYAWPESTTRPEDPSPMPEGGRILFGWSAAAGAVPLAEQSNALRAAAERGHQSFDPSRDVIDHLSLGRLSRALEKAAASGEIINVLHLLCHGTQVGQTHGLAWDADDGSGERALLDAGKLRQLLAPHAGRIRLVVLSACDSGNPGQIGNHLGSVAQNLHQAGIQAVVASRFPLSVAGSITFTEVFYDKLLVEPTSVEGALLAARQRLLREGAGRLDWASLTLHARPEDEGDTRPIAFRPYRGLLAFHAAHRRFFFGREAEIEEALADLAALAASGKPRFLVVAGASGTGKSSMVLAGVVPRLLDRGATRVDTADADDVRRTIERLAQLLGRRSPGAAAQQALSVLHREITALATAAGGAWEAVVMRPGGSPLAALESALAARRDKDIPFLLVVDQFEEIFTHVQDPAERQAFVAELWKRCSGEDNIHCITSMRVDFVGECGQIVLDASTGLRLDRVAYDEAHRVFVAQMGPAQLRTVIEEPARKVGLALSQGLAGRIIAEVGAEPTALPLVEYVLDLLWQNRRGKTLDAARYEELGGVFGALERMADAVVDELDEPSQKLARRLFSRLTHFGEGGASNTRRRVPLARILPTDPERRARFEALLERFVAARLVSRQDEGGRIVVEVAHEALLRRWNRLATWLAEDRARVIEMGKLERWAADYKAHGALLRGAQLGYAKQIRAQAEDELDEDTRAMIEASEHAEETEAEKAREKQRVERRKLVLGAAGAIAVAVAMTLLALRTTRAKAEADASWKQAVEDRAKAEEAHKQADAERAIAEKQLRIGGALNLVARHQYAAAASVMSDRSGPFPELRTDFRHLSLAQTLLALPIPKVTLSGHYEKLWHATWSPDGRRFVTASEDGAAHLWDGNGRGKPIDLPHGAPLSSAVFDREGRRVLTAALNGIAKIWDVSGPEPLVVAELRGTSQSLCAAVFSPDGTRVATATSEGAIEMWDLSPVTGPVLEKRFTGHEDVVAALDFDPEGKRIVSASWDRTACLWDARKGTRACLEGHTGPLSSAAFSPDGEAIVTASYDGTARIWDVETRKTTAVLRGHMGPINLAVFHPKSGRAVATAGDDNTVRIWAKNGEQPGTCEAESASYVEVAVLNGHEADVTTVAFSPDGHRLVTGSWDETARIWDLGRLPRPVLPRILEHYVTYALESPAQDRVLQNAPTGELAVYDVHPNAEFYDGIHPFGLLSHGKRRILTAAWRPDGKSILTGDEAGNIAITTIGERPASRERLPPLPSRLLPPQHHASILALAWNQSGDRFVSVAGQGAPLVWDADKPERPPVPLQVSAEKCDNPGASTSGKHVSANAGGFTSVAWSLRPGAREIVLGRDDGCAWWVDLDGRDKPKVLGRHHSTITAVAFSPDGERVATASQDRTVRVWKRDGTYVELVHPAPLLSVLFDARGERVITRARDNTVDVWKVDGSGQVFALAGSASTFPIAAFDVKGKGILTVDARGFLQRWDAEPDAIIASLDRANDDCATAALRERYLAEDKAEAEKGCRACAEKQGLDPDNCTRDEKTGSLSSKK